MTPEIAIVDSNTLSCLGLQNLLEEIIPTDIIRSFRSFGELMDDTPDMYVHYFISSQIYFEHTAFFLERNTSAPSPIKKSLYTKSFTPVSVITTGI